MLACLFVCLFVCLLACLFVCLFVCIITVFCGGGGENGPRKSDFCKNSKNIVKHSGLARGTPKPHSNQAQLAFWHRVQPEQLVCV